MQLDPPAAGALAVVDVAAAPVSVAPLSVFAQAVDSARASTANTLLLIQRLSTTRVELVLRVAEYARVARTAPDQRPAPERLRPRRRKAVHELQRRALERRR